MATVKGAPHWVAAMCLLPGIPPERQRHQIMFYEGLSHLAKKSTGSESSWTSLLVRTINCLTVRKGSGQRTCVLKLKTERRYVTE